MDTVIKSKPRSSKSRFNHHGFSVVEVMLASTIFAMLVTGIIGAIIYGRQSTANAGDRTRANFLAEEGIEAVRNIGAASFANLVDSATPVGNTNVETGADANVSGTTAYKVTTGASVSGAVLSLSAYIKTLDNTGNRLVQMALYADTAGAPGVRLGASTIQTVDTVGWNVFPVSDVTVTANTSYWIGFSQNGNTIFANTGTGGSAAYRLTTGYPAPNPFAANDPSTTDKPSFYMSVGSTHGLSTATNQWALSGVSDVSDIYTREVAITPIDADRKMVTSTVTWPQTSGTNQTSISTILTNWRTAIVPPVTPGPIMMAYSKTTTTPFYRIWNGTAWGAEGSASNVAGNINYVVLKSSRTRNEAILGVQTSTGAIYVQVWNGTSWGAATQVGTAGTTATRGFDIAYEKNSDRAVIAYSPNFLSADFDYRIWDGSTLSAATTVTAPPTTGYANWIEMKQNPLSSSNEIAFIMLDSNSDVYGMRWTGSTWDTMGTAATWDATASTPARKGVDVEYEQTSGRAMFMWGDATSTDNYYRIWNGTSLTAATLLDIATMGGQANWIQLAARPESNEIMMGVQDAGADLNTRKWSGTAWDTTTQHPEHSAATENIASRNFDIVWETHPSNPGVAWLLWGNGTAISAREWSGSAWGTASVLSGSDDTSFVRLRADPVSGTVFTGNYQNATSATTARDISSRQLTGGSSTWTGKNIIWGGPTSSDPAYFRIDISTP